MEKTTIKESEFILDGNDPEILEKTKKKFDEFVKKVKSLGKKKVPLTLVNNYFSKAPMSPEEINRYFDFLTENDYKADYSIKNNLKYLNTEKEKLGFCMLFFCKRHSDTDIDLKFVKYSKFTSIKSNLQSVLEDHFNEEQIKFINAKWGLLDGNPLVSDKNTLTTLKMTRNFNYEFLHEVDRKLKKYPLAKQIESILTQKNIKGYEMIEIDNKDQVFDRVLQPKSKIGPIIAYKRHEKYKADEISLGVTKDVGDTNFKFGIYSQEGYKPMFNIRHYKDSDKIRPVFLINDDQLVFGTFYTDNGGIGNEYVITKDGYVEVRKYADFRIVSKSKYKLNAKFFNDLYAHYWDIPYDENNIEYKEEDGCKIAKYYVEKKETTNKYYQIKIMKDGLCYLEQYFNDELDGISVVINGDYMGVTSYKNGIRDYSYKITFIAGSDYIEFEIADKNDKEDEYSYRYIFDLFDFENQLVYEEGKNKKIKRHNLTWIEKELSGNSLVKEASSNDKEGLTSEEKLNKMIGLNNVKTMIKRLKAFYMKNKLMNIKNNLNMFFTGNPGTGKTQVARYLAGILYENGIIKENKFVEVDRSTLIGKYIGESENITKDIIESAKGGVLFIDEAYSLYVDSTDKDYGSKILDKLVKEMEDNKGEMCFIFAGYKDKMERLYDMNPGLASRIQKKIQFDDYNKEELSLIADTFLEENKYTIEDSTKQTLIDFIDDNRDKEDTIFGNARDVRNLLESLYEIQAERTIDDIDNRTITIDDFKTYQKENVKEEPLDLIKDYVIPFKEIEELSKKEIDSSLVINEDYIKQCSVAIKTYDKKNGKLQGEGSGAFIYKDGLIATCYHVVKNAKYIEVLANIKCFNGTYIKKAYEAKIVKYDEKKDVALILIVNNLDNFEFNFYRLEDKEKGDPKLLTKVIMGGYPAGESRFSNLTITEGRVQSINVDGLIGDKDATKWLYLDIEAMPGSSGSGIINKQTGKCIGLLQGASILNSSGDSYTLVKGSLFNNIWNQLLDI